MWSTFPLFGSTLLLAVMVVASYTFAVSLAAGASGRVKTLFAARLGAYGTVALIGVSVLCLAYAFVSHDFRLRYVAHYSDRSMPTVFLLTALWGGQDGSLLWWLFLLSGYIGTCVFSLGKKHLDLQPYVIATLMAIVIFFCVLMAFAANPFSTGVSGARTDGDGLNPLLQNFYMIIHPPSLYVGFVGCSIPFAFAIAALCTGRLDADWIQACRKFTIFALLFLAIGNTLGMLWAYEELGWGGYWAWDPVENAAFMPMLSLAAFVHSVMIQERRGMLKVWNVFLICLTFFMTIFGTFLTRSGAIASVHSFAQSSIGEYFLWFLAMVAAFCLTLILYRWPELRSIEPIVGNKDRLAASRSSVAQAVSVLVGVGAGAIVFLIANVGFKKEIDANGMHFVAGALAAISGAGAWYAVKRPVSEWTSASPSNVLRGSAITAGWVVVSGLAPGAWVLSGKLGTMSSTVRVTVFSLVVGIAVFVALELVFRRMTRGLKLTPTRPRMESILSREFTFLLNNYGLLGIMLFVLVATTFPMVSEALWNEKVTVGPPYYNAWMQPLGLTVFFLMGVGTLFGWKKTSRDALKRAFVVPTTAALLAVALHFAFGKKVGFPAVVWSEPIYGGAIGSMLRVFNAYTPVLGFSLSVFNIVVIVQEFVLLFRSQNRAGEHGKGFLSKVPAPLRPLAAILLFPAWSLSLSPTGRRRYGGYIVHLGIALMFIGFTGKSWTIDRETTLAPGQTYQVERLTVQYVGPRMEVDTNKRMIFADVRVVEDGKEIGKLTPAKFIYKKMPDSPTTEVSMLHSIRDDLYLVVGSINPETKVASLQIHLNPLVGWIWFGAIILIFGSFVSMWPEFDPEESRAWRFARGSAAVAASTTIGIVLALMPVPAFAQTTATQHSGSVQMDDPKEKAVFGALRCMCGTCPRELLSTCACSTADHTRERLRIRLAKGDSPQTIIDEYTAEYGTAALAIPPDRGAMKAIYVAPLLAIAGGGIALAQLLRRWRSNDAMASTEGAKSTIDTSDGQKRDTYDDRIDAELKELDDA
ncbi:MAG TPA: cytochrome c-type biogenesis CcmF C-terminal domain-containing protein [Labilithrix sp.]|nr:cytochrome c-type biogenesis CcmF C-terminal domain-containing protein [Labilithrix sp.]